MMDAAQSRCHERTAQVFTQIVPPVSRERSPGAAFAEYSPKVHKGSPCCIIRPLLSGYRPTLGAFYA
jgi:hypothetical protein